MPARPLIAQALRELIGDAPLEDFVIVAPDEGAVKNAGRYAARLGGIGVTFIPKDRSEGDRSVKRLMRIQKDAVEGKRCIMIDDMIDSGWTLVTAADELHQAGATEITVAATHGLFSGNGGRVLAKSVIDRVIVTNTAPQVESGRVLSKKIQVLDIAPILGQAIYEIVTNGSVSKLHDD